MPSAMCPVEPEFATVLIWRSFLLTETFLVKNGGIIKVSVSDPTRIIKEEVYSDKQKKYYSQDD